MFHVSKIIQSLRHMTRLWKFYFVGVRLAFVEFFPLRWNCVESDLLPKRRSRQKISSGFPSPSDLISMLIFFFFVAYALMNLTDNRRLNKLCRLRDHKNIKAGNWRKKVSSTVQAHWSALTQFSDGIQWKRLFPRSFFDEIMMNAMENCRPNKTVSIMRIKLK